MQVESWTAGRWARGLQDSGRWFFLAALLLLPALWGCTNSEDSVRFEGRDSRKSWELLFEKGTQTYRDGDLDGAENLLRKALKESQAFAPTDPRRLQTISALATLLVQQERYTDAIPLYRETLRTIEDALGPDDIALVSVLMTLAYVCRMDEDLNGAETAYRRVIAILIKEEGARSSNLARPMVGLATVLRDQGKEKEATELERKAGEFLDEAPASPSPGESGDSESAE